MDDGRDKQISAARSPVVAQKGSERPIRISISERRFDIIDGRSGNV